MLGSGTSIHGRSLTTLYRKASEAWEQQVLRLLALLVQKYLIYWYKSKASEALEEQVLSLLALLVQKYKY